MEILITIILVAAVLLGVGGFLFFRPRKRLQAEFLYAEALGALILGDRSKAIRMLGDVVRQNTDNIQAYLQLGDLLRLDNHPRQALKIHHSLTVRPDLPPNLKVQVHKSLALDYERLADWKRAEREAEQILRHEKRNLWAVEFLRQNAERKRDWEKVMELVKTVQRLKGISDPSELARTKVAEGLDLQQHGNLKEALDCFHKATRLAPDYGDGFYQLAEAYAAHQDFNRAVENWEKFALLCPADSDAVFSKIETVLFDLGRYSEAEDFYRRLLAKDPTNIRAVVRLAHVLEEKGERQAALTLIDEALNKLDSSVPVHLMKLKLSLQTSNSHELSHLVDQIIELLSKQSPRT